MSEELNDVNTQEAVVPETTDVKEEPKEAIQPEETAEPVEVAPALESGITPVEEVDEKGVPYKNRYMEEKRKREKEVAELAEIKELLQTQVTQQKPKEYTETELKAFIAETEDTQHRLWALNELEKVQEKKFKGYVSEKLESVEQTARNAQVKQQAYKAVTQRDPELITKDNLGNDVWNTKSLLFQGINKYMKNPDIASRPDGIYIASRLAKADLLEATQPSTAKKIDEQTQDIKDLQKKTMIEGAGQQSQGGTSPFAAALEKGKSGKVEDNVDAMADILKRSGIIKE